MLIRPMTDADLPAAASLMRELSLEFILHEGSADAAAFFTAENDEAGLRGFMAAGTVYYAAEIDGALAGFIALRGNSHVYHMFVDKVHHGKGVARALWEHARRQARERGNRGVFTVNASNYAVAVYGRLGFVRTAPTQCKNGIFFNPMQLDEAAHG
ncbi:GNAT family N-acetyltransferase [Massilia sp. PAMC28688]|uniref:GNAT family N-acetyltransferase n=1 Tax=Massilia sp. PAMC28688 TaxID=2861283 RepID=UPI001C62F17E|nr:GNAT family N-acetyltransferase [Massilia sp. PAMC28688]QYF93360.1 GNAT family N-acetyltransferase [Massilia sp. PAMC28688]